MKKLKVTFKNDILFKMLFVKYEDLLKRLVAELLEIGYDEISSFVVTNTEMTPEILDDKFCRIDIALLVNDKKLVIEIQVENDGYFVPRSLYYWARNYSTALKEGNDYSILPQTILISIMNFNLFDCKEYLSVYQVLEITRHSPLTDRLKLFYYELPKLPISEKDVYGKELWLRLFRAETEEELAAIEALEVPIMTQAIEAYRQVSVSPDFLEAERLRSKARHDEAQALKNAEERATEKERKKWEAVLEAVLADKDEALRDNDTAIRDKDTAIRDKDKAIRDKDEALESALRDKDEALKSALRDKDVALKNAQRDTDAALSEKDAIIAKLQAQLNS